VLAVAAHVSNKGQGVGCDFVLQLQVEGLAIGRLWVTRLAEKRDGAERRVGSGERNVGKSVCDWSDGVIRCNWRNGTTGRVVCRDLEWVVYGLMLRPWFS
jgi:hypothetical protein